MRFNAMLCREILFGEDVGRLTQYMTLNLARVAPWKLILQLPNCGCIRRFFLWQVLSYTLDTRRNWCWIPHQRHSSVRLSKKSSTNKSVLLFPCQLPRCWDSLPKPPIDLHWPLQILMLFATLIIMSLVSTIANEIWTAKNLERHWYLGFHGRFPVLSLLENLFCSLHCVNSSVSNNYAPFCWWSICE